MQKDSRIYDDFAKLASGAMGTLSDVKREIEATLMDKIEKILGRMNLVKREEFEVVRKMAEKARAEQEALSAKLARLEQKLEKGSTSDSE